MKYLVSACLAGYPCRYDGKSNEVAFIKALVNQGLAIPVCPEQLGGLSTPRPSCELQDDGTIITREGFDRTESFSRGAQATLAIAKALNVKVAILKSNSPSCGRDFVYDGSFTGKIKSGRGLAAKLLMENGIAVFSEKEELTFNEQHMGALHT